MNVTTTTLPRRSRSDSGSPFCAVRVKPGAGPILGRRASLPGLWDSDGAGHAITATARATRAARLFVFRGPVIRGGAATRSLSRPAIRDGSRLDLLLQLVQEAPVGAL